MTVTAGIKPLENSTLERTPGVLGSGEILNTFVIGLVSLLAIATISLSAKVTRLAVEPNEPPLLEPSLPVFGHILGFIRWPSDYLIHLRQKYRLDVATLPLGHSKVYVVWSPAVVQSALCSKDLSHDRYSLDFAQKFFGLKAGTVAALRTPDAVQRRIQQRMLEAIQQGLSGSSLKTMTSRALGYLTNEINNLDTCRGRGGEGLVIPNLYVWLRDHITMSVSNTLYGKRDPFRKDPSLIHALWDFEGNFIGLLPGKLVGRLLARRAFRGRARVQAALIDFYRAGYELGDDVTPFIRERAELLRGAGVPADEIGRLEMSFMFVSTTGSAPTVYWLVANIFRRRDLLGAVRNELECLIARKCSIAELQISSVNESTCPVLISCWHEVIRLSNQFIGTRHPVKDVVVTTKEGRAYLLKQGIPFIWTAKSLHFEPDVWGEDAPAFKGDRFVNLDGTDKQKKKSSFFPFGGGKHLCPGRVFAYNEVLSFTAALVVGFEIEGMKQACTEMGRTCLGEAVLKPKHDGRESSCAIKRRQGWEGVEWKLAL